MGRIDVAELPTNGRMHATVLLLTYKQVNRTESFLKDAQEGAGVRKYSVFPGNSSIA